MWIKSLYEKAVSLTSSFFTRQNLFPEFKWIYIRTYFEVGKRDGNFIKIHFNSKKAEGIDLLKAQLIYHYPKTENSVIIFLLIVYYKHPVNFWYPLSEIRNLPFFFFRIPQTPSYR